MRQVIVKEKGTWRKLNVSNSKVMAVSFEGYDVHVVLNTESIKVKGMKWMLP